MQNKKKIKYRVISIAVSLTILANCLPLSGLPKLFNIANPITASAYTYKDESTWDDNHSYNFQSVDEFTSYCHWYATNTDFADSHKNDTISIAFSNATLPDEFPGLGHISYPFGGTVTFADTTSLTITTNRAFFTYLSDKATIKGSSDSASDFTLIINRTQDVADGSSAPILADHVVHYEGNPEDENDNATTAAKGWKIQVTGSNTFSGAIGEIGSDALVDLTFTNNTGRTIESKAANEDGSVSDAGLFCGSMGSNSVFTVKYISDNAISHSTSSANGNAGTFVGTVGTGATLNVVSDVTAISSAVTANGTGDKGFAGGLVGCMEPSAEFNLKETAEGNANRALSTLFIGGSVTGNNGVGGLYGKYSYGSAATLDLSDYNISATVCGKYCGGLFGVLDTTGGLTVSSTNLVSYTSGTGSNYAANGYFGGVIGKLTANALTDTILLQNLKINPTASASFGSFGGVIGIVDSAAYIKVENVEVSATGMAQRHAADFFGGVIGATNAESGVFVDLYGFKLSANGFYGGGIVGKFNKGVLRLTGTTDMTSAKPGGTASSTVKNGQLVGENDNVLVYTPGSWTFKRSTNAIADDLGTWGEVVRIAGIEYGIVTFDSTAHTATVVAAVSAMGTQSDLVKTALNMQLDSCGCLIMPSSRATMLSTNLSLSGDLSFAGTGITGFMRDGGEPDENGQLSTIGCYTGTFNGNDHIITLAVGEKYGDGITSASTAEGIGQIYRHQYNGLFSVLGGTVSNITLSHEGYINVRNCIDGMNIGGVAACNGGNVTLTGITANEKINYHEAANVTGTEAAGKNIGGLIGLVETDGNITINGVSSIGANIKLIGKHQSWDVYGGAIGKVTAEAFNITIGTANDTTNILTVGMKGDVSGVTAVGSNADCGGLIGHITSKGIYASRIVNINNLVFNDVTVGNEIFTPTIGNAANTNAGGFLGYAWLNTTANINGLTITKGTINNCTTSGTAGGNANVGVMCYEATGKWNVDKLTVTAMSMPNGGGKSVGMLVNKAYNGNDGLYLNVLRSGYTLTAATLPSLAKFDELAAYSAADDNAVLAGGNGAGVISINMNSARTGTNTCISARTVDNSTVAGTGTYQNQLTGITCSQTDKYANPTARYYYNLDVMNNSDGGENLLLWSVNKYASQNIAPEFKSTTSHPFGTNLDTTLSGTANMTGLSFYPLANADGYTIGAIDLKLDYAGLYTSAENISNTDNYIRDPGAANQHYLMHSGLFINSTAGNSMKVSGAMTLSGTFLEVGKYKGVLISDTMRGTFDSSSGSISLNGITPKTTGNQLYTDGYLLINKIRRDNANVAIPTLKMYNVRTGTGYVNDDSNHTTEKVANSLIGAAEGPGLNIEFSLMKLDGRDNYSNCSETALYTAYNTYNSIFDTSTLLASIKTDQKAQLIYNYTVEDDWTNDRKVTYGKEIAMTSGCEYADKEWQYYGSDTYTNPKSQNGGQYNGFSTFLPYVAIHFSAIDPNVLYYRDLKVNVVATGLTVGCGTYNDPYIISENDQLINVAAFLQNCSKASTLGRVKLPKTKPTSMTSGDRWCTDKNGSDYHVIYTAAETFTKPADAADAYAWQNSEVQQYLASAYYKVTSNVTLGDTFAGLGDGTTGAKATAFRGVIVGQTNNAGEPSVTITNNSDNPFIKFANGCVVKDIIISVGYDITREQTNNTNSNAYFGYYTAANSGNTCAYYGGIIGEVMGGDNIIDNSYVQFGDHTVTLSGAKYNNNNKIADTGLIVPVGGYVGVVMFGGLIFKNMDALNTTLTRTGLKVYYKDTDNTVHTDNNLAENTDAAKAAIYVNPIVGRVINGYAVNETGGNAKDALGNAVTQYSYSEDGYYHDDDKTERTDAVQHTLKNGKKHYPIADLNPNISSKLDVTATSGSEEIDVPNAQALFVLSLITQSGTGTAATLNGTAAHTDVTVENSRTTDESGNVIVYKTRTITDNLPVSDYTNSLSYGTNLGRSHVADYNAVGTNNASSSVSDYSDAAMDTAENSAIPYIIKRYTVGSSTVTSTTVVSDPVTTGGETIPGGTYPFTGALSELHGKELYLAYGDNKYLQATTYDVGLTAVASPSTATKLLFTCQSDNTYTLTFDDNGTTKYIAFKDDTKRNLIVRNTYSSLSISKNSSGKWEIKGDQVNDPLNGKNREYIGLRNSTHFTGQSKGSQTDLTFYYETEATTAPEETIITNTITNTISQNYPARCVTKSGAYYDINLTGSGTYYLPDSFRGLGCVGNKNNAYTMKVDAFDGKGCAIDEDIYLSKYQTDNYFNTLHAGISQSYNGDKTAYNVNHAVDNHGIGLFDAIITKDTSSAISNFTLKGSVNTEIYDDMYNTSSQEKTIIKQSTAKFLSVGGVVGTGVNGSNIVFNNITLEGTSICGSCAVGGLMGYSCNSGDYVISIVQCKTDNIHGLSVKMNSGSEMENGEKARNTIGGLVGKCFEGKVNIYGTAAKESNTNLSNYSTVRLASFGFESLNEEYRCCAGGLVGFAGDGCQAYDMHVISNDSSSPVTIGGRKIHFAGGICGGMQSRASGAYDKTENDHTAGDLIPGYTPTCYATFKNCTVENINVEGQFVGGLYGGKWGTTGWTPYSITIDNCNVKGNSTTPNTIQAYEVYSKDLYAGGFIGRGLVLDNGDPNILIKDSIVSDYNIYGTYCGGFIGFAGSFANGTTITCYIHDSSVENCTIGTGSNFAGGAIGHVQPKNPSTADETPSNKMLGYNIKLEDVTLGGTKNGAWIGCLDAGKTSIQFTGIGIYGNGFANNVGETKSGASLTNLSFVFADYDGACASMNESNENYSTFNASADSNVSMPKYPYVNVNPQSALGSNEVISGDGAVLLDSSASAVSGFTGTGKKTMAAKIYSEKDTSGTAKQYYTTFSDLNIGDVSDRKISYYMNRSKTDEGDRISTFATERGMTAAELAAAGVDDFAVLVIANANDTETTDLINRYIQLVTNTTNDYATESTEGYYHVDIKTCEYNGGSFSITNATNHGIENSITSDGKGIFSLNNDYADSLNGTFTLLDVQFMDPMHPIVKNAEGTVTDAGKIAYHLYVPVYTIREMAVKFYTAAKTGAYSVSYPGTNQYESLINECITEQNSTPNTYNKRKHADTLDTWVTQYIRYEYAALDINALLNSGNVNWNYKKTVDFETITNGDDKKRLPDGTYMVLVDPNGNSDMAYYATVNATNLTNYTIPDTNNGTKNCWRIPLTAFKAEDYDGNDANNTSFSIPTINDVIAKSIVSTPNNTDSGRYHKLTAEELAVEDFEYDVYAIENGLKTYYKFREAKNGDCDLAVNSAVYEDYYISVKVPHTAVVTETDVYYYQIKLPSDRFQISDIDEVNGHNKSPRTAGITQQNEFQILIADLFNQTGSMVVTPDVQQITNTNHTITAKLSTEVTPKNSTAIYYLNDDSFFHSFYITLVRTSAKGIENDIKALKATDVTATYQINSGTVAHCANVDLNLKENYLNVQTASDAQSATLIGYLRGGSHSFTINADIEMEFDQDELPDEFPKRSAGDEYGVNVRAESNIAYESSSLANTSMTNPYPLDRHNYYIETVKSASLKYSPHAEEIDTVYDEIGYNSKNQTTLGVNGISANNADRTDMPVNTQAFYNVQLVSDSELSEAKVLKLTFKLEKKNDSEGTPVPDADYAEISALQNYIDGNITFKSKDAVVTASATGSTVTAFLNVEDCDYAGKLFKVDISFNAKSGGSFKDYANYKIDLKADLYKIAVEDQNGKITGVNNESLITTSSAEDYLIYTNAKINPQFIRITNINITGSKTTLQAHSIPIGATGIKVDGVNCVDAEAAATVISAIEDELETHTLVYAIAS